MRFVVVTGMSGSGKSTALKMLEDTGFYCVDNLPVSLIEKFVDLISMPNSEINKVALGLDARAGQALEEADGVLAKLKEKGYDIEILFLEADAKVLIKRYKETRRVASSWRRTAGLRMVLQRKEGSWRSLRKRQIM